MSLLVFDVLHAGGEPQLSRTYDQRRAVLDDLGLAGPHWATPPAFQGDGAAAMAASQGAGPRGGAGQAAGVHLPARAAVPGLDQGQAHPDAGGRRRRLVAGGGPRAGGLGSLLLGVPDDQGRLVYAGHVGTGFSDRVLADLMARLTGLEQASPPFADEVPRAHAKGARWVTPVLVGEVAFSEWTRDGRMRHPTWRGLRPDKEPGEVRRES